jgi:hypothetical protein
VPQCPARCSLEKMRMCWIQQFKKIPEFQLSLTLIFWTQITYQEYSIAWITLEQYNSLKYPKKLQIGAGGRGPGAGGRGPGTGDRGPVQKPSRWCNINKNRNLIWGYKTIKQGATLRPLLLRCIGCRPLSSYFPN